jgi:hypothetical protein
VVRTSTLPSTALRRMLAAQVRLAKREGEWYGSVRRLSRPTPALREPARMRLGSMWHLHGSSGVNQPLWMVATKPSIAGFVQDGVVGGGRVGARVG